MTGQYIVLRVKEIHIYIYYGDKKVRGKREGEEAGKERGTILTLIQTFQDDHVVAFVSLP